ncbi:MAG: hypothetical protein ACAI44_23235 [Candidatus Sericytochromatia bacterium]
MRILLITFTALGLLSACTPEKACTLIGCVDGLNITLKGQVAQSYTLKLKVQGQPDQNLSCPEGTSGHICFPNGSVFVNNYTPQSVEITYTAGEKTVTKKFNPSYSTSNPNGPDCGPTCKQARIELEVGNS